MAKPCCLAHAHVGAAPGARAGCAPAWGWGGSRHAQTPPYLGGGEWVRVTGCCKVWGPREQLGRGGCGAGSRLAPAGHSCTTPQAAWQGCCECCCWIQNLPAETAAACLTCARGVKQNLANSCAAWRAAGGLASRTLSTLARGRAGRQGGRQGGRRAFAVDARLARMRRSQHNVMCMHAHKVSNVSRDAKCRQLSRSHAPGGPHQGEGAADAHVWRRHYVGQRLVVAIHLALGGAARRGC